MKYITKEHDGFYWAIGFIEGLREGDKYNATHSAALKYLLLGLDRLYEHMIDIKESAGEQTG
jgi:hypothetical protein